MLFSLSIIFLLGLLLGKIFHQLKLPSLLGMLISGIILGPYSLNLIDSSILSISNQLKEIALIIILTRAGLALDINDLKKVGRPAILLCFVPATFEIIGMLVFAPLLLGLSLLEAAILGTVIAAVSPAVIVPKMIKLQEEGYGDTRKIPQMLLAGSSIDDIYVIVLFTITTRMALDNSFQPAALLAIPSSIIFGILIGIFVGWCFSILFKKFHIRDTTKVILMLCISFLLLSMEHTNETYFKFSSFLAIMTTGMTLLILRKDAAKRLAVKYSKWWVAAEVLLFVLIGANLDLSVVVTSGIKIFILLSVVLLIRMAGVYFSVLGSSLPFKEKLFCMIAYMPKATVQAAIGSLPLSMGLPCGQIVLTVAVLSILITAPLGSYLIDISYAKLLQKSPPDNNGSSGISASPIG